MLARRSRHAWHVARTIDWTAAFTSASLGVSLSLFMIGLALGWW